MTFLVFCRPNHTLLFLVDERIAVKFLVLCRPYRTLLFLVDEKDIRDVPCVVQALPHAAVPGG
jgi:hypothetical protein